MNESIREQVREPVKKPIKKPMVKMLTYVGILFGLIIAYKIFGYIMFKHFMSANKSPISTVSAMKVDYADWQPQVNAAASLRAVKGVYVTTELAGMIRTIYFTPGAMVKQGAVLVQLNADSNIGQLHALQANEELAEIVLKRDSGQYAAQGISKAQLDSDSENLKNLQGQVAQQQATVLKQTIVAPFTGRLGISAVNPGQYLNAGDKVVPLQQLDPIYVDFYVPQETLAELSVGQPVSLGVDAVSGNTFTGKITTIDPIFDNSTRNVEVEATIANPKDQLVPGMFGSVKVDTGKPQRFLTLPLTAISFNPYGDIVFIVTPTKDKDKKGNPVSTVNQKFVTTGEVRGDQVTVVQGLQAGDTVVTSGQLKLKNGSRVVINNSLVPTNDPNPDLTNEN